MSELNEFLTLDILAERINESAKKHIPNVMLPERLQCIFEGVPHIYRDGLVHGVEVANEIHQKFLEDKEKEILLLRDELDAKCKCIDFLDAESNKHQHNYKNAKSEIKDWEDAITSSKEYTRELEKRFVELITELNFVRDELRIAQSKIRNRESELEKWRRPFDQERLDACKDQASHKDSLAAQSVYITALEHALKGKENELTDLKSHGGVWLIYFDDRDRLPEIWTNEQSALKRYKDVSISYNAHLFARVNTNSRDAKIDEEEIKTRYAKREEPEFMSKDELQKLPEYATDDYKSTSLAHSLLELTRRENNV